MWKTIPRRCLDFKNKSESPRALDVGFKILCGFRSQILLGFLDFVFSRFSFLALLILSLFSAFSMVLFGFLEGGFLRWVCFVGMYLISLFRGIFAGFG